MSRLLLHDAGDGGKLTWAGQTVAEGHACGLVLSPFETPPVSMPRRPSARTCVQLIEAVGGEVFFDPMTHGATGPNANKFTYYDEWDLWPGQRGDLSTSASRAQHVKRALAAARDVGAQPIAPIRTLSRPYGTEAEDALEMTAEARRIDEGVYISVAGTDEFWRAGPDLDVYVGELAALMPAGFAITVVRPVQRYPWLDLDQEEIYGICRTVHTLSFRGAQVVAMYSDLSGLPAVAAGADRVGSGWNIGGRQCSYDGFREQAGGSPSYRPTYQGLLASLKRPESERFEAADPVSSERLFPGNLPAANDKNGHWQHHLAVLSDVIETVAQAGDRGQRARRLLRLYRDASQGFVTATAAAGALEAGASAWIAPHQDGIRLWMDDEGF